MNCIQRRSVHWQCLISELPYSHSQRTLRTFRRRYASAAPPLKSHITANDKEEFAKLARRVVEAAKGDRPGWSQTRFVRSEEMSAIAAVQNQGNHARLRSEEATRFHAPTTDDYEDGLGLQEQDVGVTLEIFKKGAYAEVRRNMTVVTTIILGVEYAERRWSVVSLASNGSVWRHLPTDVTYLIPDIAPQDLVQRAGLTDIPANNVQVMARVELLRLIRHVDYKLTTALAKVRTTRLDDLYETVRSTDSREWSKVTVSDVFNRVYREEQKMTPMFHFALHLLLIRNPLYFQADPISYLTSQTFYVRPRLHVEEIEAVRRMISSNSPSIKSFIRKARQIVDANRTRSKISRGGPPSTGVSQEVVLNLDDRLILGYLLRALSTKRRTQKDPYEPHTRILLKEIQCDRTIVHEGLHYQTLVELGVIPPWYDVVTSKPELEMDLLPEELSPKVRAQNDLVAARWRPLGRSGDSPMGPEDFYTTDTLASMRRDFGNMPVYVIDDPGAEELDDGVSIECIPNDPTSDWVHVHVADPTATIPPTHIFAKQARQQMETQYYFHRSWPMLPRSLLSKGLGLTASSEHSAPQRVLTFSFKVDGAGDIVDYTVQPGIVRNVQVLNYDAIDLAFGTEPPRNRYPFGGKPPLPPPAQLDKANLDNLRILHMIAKRLAAQRLTTNCFAFFVPYTEISISPKDLDQTPTLGSKPTIFGGFPELRYTINTREMQLVGARSMVAELMKAACRVSSRFCNDRGIPVVRRATQSATVPSEEAFADVFAMRGPDGLVNYYDALRHEIVASPGEYTIEPKMHWCLGIPDGEGYARATSPLRRFMDLVTHWQIKHALLNPQAKPLFDAEYMLDLCKDMTAYHRLRRRNAATHGKFWCILFLQRWISGEIHRDPNIPNPLQDMKAIAIRQMNYNFITKSFECRVWIDSIGLDALLTGLDENDHFSVGDIIPIKLKDLRLGMTPVTEVEKA